MPTVLAAIAGALFGAGLLVSGMTRPAKVLAFLDASRDWDPSLALVMLAAAAVYALVFHGITRRRATPWFGGLFHLPTRRDLDVPLIVGSALFGIGWGLGGLCPGPGLVMAAAGSMTGLAFTAAVIAGMLLQHASARDLRRVDRAEREREVHAMSAPARAPERPAPPLSSSRRPGTRPASRARRRSASG
jgi:uncharacterized membrane protein YedE/YeeE